jgi:hypothetical protein
VKTRLHSIAKAKVKLQYTTGKRVLDIISSVLEKLYSIPIFPEYFKFGYSIDIKALTNLVC